MSSGAHLSACTQTQAPCNASPPLPGCQQLIYDWDFEEDCSYWVASGAAVRQTFGSNDFYELYGLANGSLSQDVAVPANTTHTKLHLDITVDPLNVGSERLYVEILSSSGTLLETVEIVNPTYTTSVYGWYDIGPYSNQTITVRFRSAAGAYGGDTIFMINSVLLDRLSL